MRNQALWFSEGDYRAVIQKNFYNSEPINNLDMRDIPIVDPLQGGVINI